MATVTVKQSGGDYSTLASAMSARSADGDTISIEGTWSVDDTAVCTNSYNTTVTTDSDSKNPGHATGTPTHYRLRNTSGHSVTLSDSLIITGVDIGSQSTGISDEIFRVNAGSTTLLATDCLFWFNARNSEQDVYYTNAQANCVATFVNCGMWNIHRGIVDAFNGSGTNTFKFNSCHGYDIGNAKSGGNRSGVFGSSSSSTFTVDMFNCAWNMNASYVVSSGGGDTLTVVATDCITNQTDADFSINEDSETLTRHTASATWTAGTPTTGDYVAVNDITGGAMDLRLQGHADNDAQDKHTNGSGAGLTMPTTDIIGTSRPQNTNYDVGFFEIEVVTDITGTSTTTNADDTSNASGTLEASGNAATTNADDTSNASGTLEASGNAATTNANDTSNATGIVGIVSITGVSNTINANDVSNISGILEASGISNTINANDVTNATGIVGVVTGITGTSAAANDNDFSRSSGIVGVLELGKIIKITHFNRNFKVSHPDRMFKLTHYNRNFKVIK